MSGHQSENRKTPQANEAEQGALGACLRDATAAGEAIEVLTVEMFRSLHRPLWRVICDLDAKGEPVDIISVGEELNRRGQMQEIGGAGYLLALREACDTPRNVLSYARRVKDAYVKRSILEANKVSSDDVYSGDYSPDELIERQEARLLELSRHQVQAEANALPDLVAAQRERILTAARNPGKQNGTPTGFPDLDRMLGLMKPSELITIAGQSSMGKSALASQIAFNAARLTRRPVIVFSLEMSKEQWLDRMMGAESSIEGHKLRNGILDDAEWQRLDAMQNFFSGLPMHIVDTPALTTREIKAQCRRIGSKHGTPALIVVDYLQIAEPSERIKEERLRVTQIVRDFKNLARQIEAPVIDLSQLSRAPSQRENKRPQLSDLRETSAIEAESDAVLFVYRPSYYKPKNEVKEWGVEEADEIIVGKQRNGPTGIVPVRFRDEYARFENLAAGEY